ncbi:hypothetical protein V5O48_014874 [Marasmius crinis-equi]|uniref:Uncharacterized protein n=1 Tax=Marasmius crinis-equi TaxID=585013 RepID=A0ABR3EW32_9AGAR
MGTHLREISVTLAPSPIERSFEDFTDALARAFLVARHTPAAWTSAFREEEYDGFHDTTGVRLHPPSGPTFLPRKGNMVESRRMLAACLLRWYEVWGLSLPEGVRRARLSGDILRTIMANASMLQADDRIGRKEGEKPFPYRTYDWREVMTRDLAASNWTRWIHGGMAG